MNSGKDYEVMDDTASYLVEELPQIGSPHGNVVKLGPNQGTSIEEAYISNIRRGAVSAWKMHQSMVARLTVVRGVVRFVFPSKQTAPQFESIELSFLKPSRLTIFPRTWFGFQGLDEANAILNLASELHRPDEIERVDKEAFAYDWSLR